MRKLVLILLCSTAFGSTVRHIYPVDDSKYHRDLVLSPTGTDSIAFWDNSASDFEWLTTGTGLEISDTVLSATGDTNDINAMTIVINSIQWDNGSGYIDGEKIADDTIDDDSLDFDDITLVDFTDDVGYLKADGSVDLTEDWVISANSITLSAGSLTATSFIIGSNTLNTSEWAYLDGQDQKITKASSVEFASITDGTALLTGGNLTTIGNIGLGVTPVYVLDVNDDGAIAARINTANTQADRIVMTLTNRADRTVFDIWNRAGVGGTTVDSRFALKGKTNGLTPNTKRTMFNFVGCFDPTEDANRTSQIEMQTWELGSRFTVIEIDGNDVLMPYAYSTIAGHINRDLYIDSNGLLGYIPSSKKDKEKIKKAKDTDWIYDVNVVDFDYKKGKGKKGHTGIIAEELAEIKPELVSYAREPIYDEVDVNGVPTQVIIGYTESEEPETVNYNNPIFVASILNELQKLKERVDELEQE